MDALTVLTKAEQDELTQCETVIRQGLDTFVQVGQALETIRDKKLYRLDYSTFEEYCQAKWDFSRVRASQLISSTQVYNNLLTSGLQNNLPTSERPLRPLASLSPEQQVTAYETAVEMADDKPPTSKQVDKAVETLGFPKPGKSAGKSKSSGGSTFERQSAPSDDFNQEPQEQGSRYSLPLACDDNQWRTIRRAFDNPQWAAQVLLAAAQLSQGEIAEWLGIEAGEPAW